MPAEKTIVEQLAAANDAVKALESRIATEAKANADKIAALEKSVADLTASSTAHKAEAEKALADLATAKTAADVSAKSAGELTEKVKTLEARLADPSFKAASTPPVPPVAEGGKTVEPKDKKALVAEYQAESKKENPNQELLADLRRQIFEAK